MTTTNARVILPAEATGRAPQVQAMLECWHRMKCWMGQLNAGRKMPAEKYGYIHRKMEIEADQLRLHLLHPEISTASPNTGLVTAEMLEAAARAILKAEWEVAGETPEDAAWIADSIIDGIADGCEDDALAARMAARAAFEAIGLTVEG